MGPILQERKRPTFGQTFNQGLSEGLDKYQQFEQIKRQKEGQLEAAKKLGIDPTAFNLPEKAQAEYFKNQFTKEKPLNDLQLSQKALNEARLGQVQSQQNLFNSLSGNNEQTFQSVPAKENEENVQGNEQQSGSKLSKVPHDKLVQLAAFVGQPGEQGVIGNMAQGELERRKNSPEVKRDQFLTQAQAQADIKYNTQLQEASKQHELKEKTLNDLDNLNKKGVTGKPWEKFAEKVGLVNLTSEGRREFAADVKNLITDIRSILGGQFSNFEFQTILNAYPSADFSKEANSAIIKNLKYFQDIKKKEVVFAEQLKKENRGKIPVDFQSQVNEKVREYANSKVPEIKENMVSVMNEEYGIPKGHVLMFDSKGEPLSVPEKEVTRYLDLGADLP